MSYIDPHRLFRCLVTEVESGVDFSTGPLIDNILAATTEFGQAGCPHDVLVEVSLGYEFLETEAEVLVICRSSQTFENVRAAVHDERLRLQVRSLQTAESTSYAGGDANSRGDELAIFGVIERKCFFCIRQDLRHNCLVFQFC
jgi:hypothetical protein